MFSKACEYGIRAVLYVTAQSLHGRRVVLKDIATQIDSPEPFTAKILQQLARNRLILSAKGPNGGFSVSPEAMEQIKLKDIVLAIDGDGIITDCGLGLKKCDENSPCPIHFRFKPIRAEIVEMLETVTLKDLSLLIESGDTVLKV